MVHGVYIQGGQYILKPASKLTFDSHAGMAKSKDPAGWSLIW